MNVLYLQSNTQKDYFRKSTLCDILRITYSAGVVGYGIKNGSANQRIYLVVCYGSDDIFMMNKVPQILAACDGIDINATLRTFTTTTTTDGVIRALRDDLTKYYVHDNMHFVTMYLRGNNIIDELPPKDEITLAKCKDYLEKTEYSRSNSTPNASLKNIRSSNVTWDSDVVRTTADTQHNLTTVQRYFRLWQQNNNLRNTSILNDGWNIPEVN